MGGYRYHQNLDLGSLDSIDHAPLDAESRGAVPGPLPRQRFVMEAFDQTQPTLARHSHDVLPLLVANQDLAWGVAELTIDSTVFENLPHGI